MIQFPVLQLTTWFSVRGGAVTPRNPMLTQQPASQRPKVGLLEFVGF